MLKIAFSTIGCPEWSWIEVTAMAKDLGFDGIEIRGLGEELHAPRALPFTPAELPRTLERLQSLGLQLTCLSSGCCLKDPARRQEILAE